MRSHQKLGWLLIAALLTLLVGFVIYQYTPLGLEWVYLASINFVTLFLFRYDKWTSKRQWSRIPNRVLLIVALAGGSLGALLAIYLRGGRPA